MDYIGIRFGGNRNKLRFNCDYKYSQKLCVRQTDKQCTFHSSQRENH